MNTHNKTALITGATSGFGTIIAEHLARKGYSIIVLGRSKEKLEALELHLKSIKSDLNIKLVNCNLSSLNSVSQACEEVRNLNLEIDLFVLNAGLWNFELIETEDHIEETFQVNLLAPIIIFRSLFDLIPKKGNSKVIFTASGLHQGTINFEDIEFRKDFSGFKAYRQSKLAIILTTRLFSKKPENSGISFYCVHPGMVNTQLGRSAGWFSKLIFQLMGKSVEKGAETHIHLIDQPTEKLTSGEYYANSKITKTTQESYNMNMAEKLLKVVDSYLQSTFKVSQ